MKTPTMISIGFMFFTALLSPAYYLGTAMLSMGSGPFDHIAILYVAVPLILLHGLLVAPYGLRGAVKSTLIYFATIAAACLAMSYNMSITPGFSDRHVFRPIEALAWSVPWFALALSSTIPVMWGKSRNPSGTPDGHQPQPSSRVPGKRERHAD